MLARGRQPLTTTSRHIARLWLASKPTRLPLPRCGTEAAVAASATEPPAQRALDTEHHCRHKTSERSDGVVLEHLFECLHLSGLA